MRDYTSAVTRLLTLGEPDSLGTDWPDYRALGVGPEHVPDLVRMLGDPALNGADSESKEVWAPLHAWRALGQLRSPEGVGPLLQQLDDCAEDDWCHEEVPRVLGLIGPAALPALSAYLADPAHGLYHRWAVADAVGHVAREHPAARPECVDVLTRALARAADNEPELNGAIVSNLLHLKARESAPEIERAFAGGHVDEFICGDWELARYELGLRPDPPPRQFHDHFNRRVLSGPPAQPARGPKARAKERARARRKQASQARKRNRRR
jgi:hypothetical protein